MKTKRTYLKVPGQTVRITIEGPSGAGKVEVADRLIKLFQGDGLFAEGVMVGMASVVSVTCPTASEAQSMYLDALDEHQRETLRAHLDALGYEL